MLEHLVPIWWCCLRGSWNLLEVAPCWRKSLLGVTFEALLPGPYGMFSVCFLNEDTVGSASFLHMLLCHHDFLVMAALCLLELEAKQNSYLLICLLIYLFYILTTDSPPSSLPNPFPYLYPPHLQSSFFFF